MDDRENAWVDLGLSHRLWFTPDDPYDTGSLRLRAVRAR